MNIIMSIGIISFTIDPVEGPSRSKGALWRLEGGRAGQMRHPKVGACDRSWPYV